MYIYDQLVLKVFNYASLRRSINLLTRTRQGGHSYNTRHSINPLTPSLYSSLFSPYYWARLRSSLCRWVVGRMTPTQTVPAAWSREDLSTVFLHTDTQTIVTPITNTRSYALPTLKLILKNIFYFFVNNLTCSVFSLKWISTPGLQNDTTE